ncbi:MAG: hypothetical protein L6Q33_01035 [Bacteriovoracaceae bacterium]|jgi:hypothetical protein|nr:hypothetical protein [Bacteriovoracaceae bacterium]
MGKINGAMLVERVVLESLSKGGKTLAELSEDTGLRESMLNTLTQQMAQKGWLRYEKGLFSLQLDHENSWLTEINRKENLNSETKELMNSLSELYFKENSGLLKVQKLMLNDQEERILNSHLKNLECFFQNVRDERRRKPKADRTEKQRIVIWGASFYSDLLKMNLQAV